jgi:hypothetical protein
MTTLVMLALGAALLWLLFNAKKKKTAGIGIFERTAEASSGKFRQWRIKCPKASCGRTITSETYRCLNCETVGRSYIETLKPHGVASCYMTCATCNTPQVHMKCLCGASLYSMISRAIV